LKGEKMNYQNIDAVAARQLIRSGEWNRPTTGLALGHVQANLVILPQSWAEEFTTFCHLNPQAAPLLDMTSPGNPHPTKVAPQADLRIDVPLYRVYHEGRFVEEPTDILSLWQEDFVAFLLGCSFSAERALIEQGIPLRHLEQNKNVAMYQTSRSCAATPRFHGPLVVSMRPVRKDLIDRVVEITGRYPLAHSAPIHIGDPLALGISDLAHPDWGDAVSMNDDDIPVFWACGVTPQAVIQQVKPEIAITHAPGHMFITDWLDTAIYQLTN
jgi:uncharacterized protein YcsI (UPF0317 family)